MSRHAHATPFTIRPPVDLVSSHPELRRLSHVLSLKYAYDEVEDLNTVGSALWNILNLLAAFDSARDQAGAAFFPVIIESYASEIQSPPWMTLYHPRLTALSANIVNLRRTLTLFGRLTAPK